MTTLTPEQSAKLDALQHAYAHALDSKDMNAWLGCFSEREDATYICAPKENVDMGLPMAHMLDDCHARLQDRVNYVDQVWVGTFEDYQTRHFVQRLSVETKKDGTYAVLSNFNILSTEEQTGLTAVLVAGVYEDVVAIEGGEAKLVSRRAILDTNVQPRYLVYPI